MLRYYELLTDEDLAGVAQRAGRRQAHPMDAKKRLAELLVARFHGAARQPQRAAAFEERFQQRHLDATALDEITVAAKDGHIWLPGLLHDAKLVKSNTEARRLLKQRAVRIDGATVESEDYPCGATELVLEVGKRRAIRVRVL